VPSTTQQYTKYQLRGLHEQTKRIDVNSYSSLAIDESNRIINNVLDKALRGETQLSFRILCNPKPFTTQQKGRRVNDYDNDQVLCSILGVDGSYLYPTTDGKMELSSIDTDERMRLPSIPERALKILTQNKELTERVLDKLKEKFPDSNMTTIQPLDFLCKKYVLSW
jgi:hypothetical protein